MFTYEGIALTSIDVIDVIDSTRGNNIVKFDGSIEGKADDKTATFLKNITQLDNTGIMFEAEKISVEDAAEFINNATRDGQGKPLFCVHGVTVQPAQHLKSLKDASPLFNQGKYTLVPVMWPCGVSIDTYFEARKLSAGAGGAFRTLKEGIDSFPSKSLLTHSMGNRVLRYAADEGFKFDNIFMVSADVRFDLFHEEYINSGGPGSEDGKHIVSMLARTEDTNEPKGKVYVLVNGSDYALIASRFNPTTSFIYRLGSVGAHYYSTGFFGSWIKDKTKSHPDVRDYVENKMCNPLLGVSEKGTHSYQFMDFAVAFYQEKHVR